MVEGRAVANRLLGVVGVDRSVGRSVGGTICQCATGQEPKDGCWYETSDRGTGRGDCAARTSCSWVRTTRWEKGGRERGSV